MAVLNLDILCLFSATPGEIRIEILSIISQLKVFFIILNSIVHEIETIKSPKRKGEHVDEHDYYS